MGELTTHIQFNTLLLAPQPTQKYKNGLAYDEHTVQHISVAMKPGFDSKPTGTAIQR